MAYKSKKIVVKKKHYTKTKAEKERDKEAVRVMLGGEPTDHEIENLDQPLRYADALSWYRQTCDVKDARTFLEDFLEEAQNKHLNDIKRVPDQWINLTACWIARLASRGAILPDTAIPFLKKQIAIMVTKAGKEAEFDAEGNPIIIEKPEKATIQENIRGKASELVAEIEGMIDDGVADNGWSAYQWLAENQVSSKIAETVAGRFKPILHELLEVKRGEDEQLIEGYRHLKPKQLRILIDFYQALIDDTNKFAQVNKKVKAARAKKPASIEKKLKLFKYMRQDDKYNIASIDPAKILRANELWTFNTATKILTVYRTTAGDVLDVHRTAITHFEPKMSMAKRIGRDTEDVLKTVIKGTRPQLRGLMDSIKSGPAPFSDRLHDRVILLRAE